MLINVTIQTFLSENELELSEKRWTDVKTNIYQSFMTSD
jgi:hypothetical protein